MNDDQRPNPQPMTPEPPAFQPMEIEPSTVPQPSYQQPQPSFQPSPTPPMPVAPMPPRPKKKKLILAIIIAGVVAVLVGGSALAYNFWYQNPDKVIGDGLMNALSAKTLSFTSEADVKGDTPGVVTLNGKMADGAFSVDGHISVKVENNKYALSGSGQMDKTGNLYLKVENVDKLISTLSSQNPSLLSGDIKKATDDLVSKVNNQWIKISNSDIKSFSDSYAKDQKCLQTTLTKLREDKATATELGNLYKKHRPFAITKKLGSKDGSLGYELKDNKDEAKAFIQGLKETNLYKTLHNCDNSITIDTDDIALSSDSKMATDVWVSRWTHQITKLTADAGDGTTMMLEPRFNQQITITPPRSTKSVNDIRKAIEDFSAALSTATLQSPDTTTSETSDQETSESSDADTQSPDLFDDFDSSDSNSDSSPTTDQGLPDGTDSNDESLFE